MMKYLYSILSFGLALLPQQSHARQGPCPFLGPVFPPVRDPLSSSTFANTIDQLNNTFHELERNGTFRDLNATFYIQAFSASETLFQHGYVPPEMKGFLTSQTLDEDTVFRVGSVSKLITVYTLLAEVGMERMNDPVTRWVPELARAAKKDKDPARRVQWDQVTIGQLCGHMAGISRNLGLFDIATYTGPSNTSPEQYGLPLLDDKEKPRCSITEPTLGPCSREEFFQGLTAKTNFPITSTSNTPIYSNLAYQILAYALEGMTGHSFEKSLESSLLQPLSMERTTLEAPESKENAIIPENDLLSWWNVTTGDSSPYGGMFSTAADLTKLGKSILNSSILNSSTTRSWLKPITHTADLHMSVGMPWEIRRALLPLGHSGTRVVDLYTKNGAFGLYSAMVVLSPDHELGYVVLLAGSGGEKLLDYLPNLLAETLLPAAEHAARETAAARFSGRYLGISNTMTVEMNETLVVRNWTREGIDVLAAHASFLWPESGVEPVLRLYPMGLEDDRIMSFRGIYKPKAVEESEAKTGEEGTEALAGPFTTGCVSWGLVDMLTYGNVGSDDFEFEIDGTGKVTGLRPRVMRETLEKID